MPRAAKFLLFHLFLRDPKQDYVLPVRLSPRQAAHPHLGPLTDEVSAPRQLRTPALPLRSAFVMSRFNISLADVRLYLSQFVRVCLCLSMAFPNVVPLYRQCKAVFTGTCTRNYSYVHYEVFLRVPVKSPRSDSELIFNYQLSIFKLWLLK